MPQNNFSIGRDISLDIIGQAGPIRLNLITSFESKQDATMLKIKGLDSIIRPLRFFDGWNGSFNVTRQDATIDQYFVQLENNYYSGLNEASITILETITETSGALSQFRYTGVLLKYDDSGTWKADSAVEQKLSFFASRKLQVA